MAKTSKPRGRKQPRKSQSSHDLEKILVAGERSRVRGERSRIKADETRKAEYERRLAELERTGIYQPKSETLTSYRRGKINRTYNEYKAFLDKDEFAFVPLSPAGLKYAKQFQMKTTAKGAFYERNGYTKIYERKSKTFKGKTEVRKAFKAKAGVMKGKWIEDLEPLVPLDEMDKQEGGLRAMANAFGPLEKNERLTFIVSSGGHEGYSYNTYSSIDLLMNDLKKRYKRSDSARIMMFANITIRKTTLTKGRAVEWNKEAEPHRPPKRKARKGKHYGSHKGRG